MITDKDQATTPPTILKALQSIQDQLRGLQLPWTQYNTPNIQRDVIFQLISSA